MSTTSAGLVSAAELRRRVRAAEELRAKTREMAATNALTAREAAVKAARAKEEADVTAREAAAVVLRLFDNDAELVSELLGVPAEELEREAKPVTAARAKEIIESLRAHPSAPVPPGPVSLGWMRRTRLLRFRSPLPRSSRRTTAGLMPPENGLGPGLFPLAAVNGSGPVHDDEQLVLIGEPTPVRVPAVEWSVWLANESVQARYWAKVYRTSSTEDCWFFFGGISSTGHASFRAASRPGGTRRGTVPGHLYGYQFAHGVIPRLGWGTDSPTICHTCDNHSCQQPTHLRMGTAAENRAEWLARRRDPGSPLADLPRPGRTLPCHWCRHPGPASTVGSRRARSNAQDLIAVHGDG